MKNKPDKALAPFKRIFLQDSTQAQLHEQLAEAFKGSGGSASQASVKIDLIYEVKSHRIHRLLIGPGTTSDQARADDLVEELHATDLLIRELGYFKLATLATIVAKEAYFLSICLTPWKESIRTPIASGSGNTFSQPASALLTPDQA
jgi:hypothetical protein